MRKLRVTTFLTWRQRTTRQARLRCREASLLLIFNSGSGGNTNGGARCLRTVLVLFFMIFGDQNLIICDYLVLALGGSVYLDISHRGISRHERFTFKFLPIGIMHADAVGEHA
jgi:hypothetical protein